jgi:crotonobetainyl-CoA:carnitine CoA-transferase CaiB-like acyl-CoA transferase
MKHSGTKVALLKTPGRVGAPQTLGASTRKVLAELGYSPDEIEDLRSRGVTVCAEGY